jgi:hypothetical protein
MRPVPHDGQALASAALGGSQLSPWTGGQPGSTPASPGLPKPPDDIPEDPMMPDHTADDRCLTTARKPLFPVACNEDDPRFTFGLVLDVMAVLHSHGYPNACTSTADYIELRHALFGFIHGSANGGGEL